MQLQFIKHTGINKLLWNNCISKSANGLIYATAEYLDALSPNWDGLVFGNYEAVMPLTWRKKLGIFYLCQPAFAQQLGVFFSSEISPIPIQNFLEQLPTHYSLVEIFLNHQNSNPLNATQHINYILPLNSNYSDIAKNYKSDLIKNLNRTKKFNLQYSESGNVAEAIALYKENYASKLAVREKDYEAFIKLSQQLHNQGKAIVRKVSMPSGELLSIGLFLKDTNRIYNVASTTLPNGRTMEANHFLFDQLIHEFAGTALILDFEGSDLPGVARFYQKFGAINQPYFFYHYNHLSPLIKWLKR